jgi:hypothetical protein
MPHDFMLFFPTLPSPGCKVQRTFIVIVLEVDASPKPDKVFQTANVALTTGIM